MARRKDLRTENDYKKKNWGLVWCPYFESFSVISELIEELEKSKSGSDQLHLIHRYSNLLVNEILSIKKENSDEN